MRCLFRTGSRFLLLAFHALVLNSCSNELVLTADYDENAVVYALLDPGQSIQFIKINKVFTNTGARAQDVAKIPDSLYFDSISPMLVELENGAVRRTIPLFRANILLKDSGTFAHSPNYLYVTKEQVYSYFNYRLDLRLPKTGRYITATTNMVYMTTATFYQPVSVNQRIFNIPLDNRFSLIFQTGRNGKVYDAFFNFNFMEIQKSDTNVKALKTIKWRILSSYRTIDDQYAEIVNEKIPGRQFDHILMNEISFNAKITRRFMPCSFELVGGNEQLDAFIESSRPSLGITQKQVDYSNVSNGLGLFAARNTMILDKVELSGAVKNLIINDTIYKHLAFH
jgi:hypothetical protein